MVRVRVRDRDYMGYVNKHKSAKWRDVYRKGRYVFLEDQPLELFRLRVLSEALDRTPRCITWWEQRGLFPKSMFHLYNPKEAYEVRWYSAAQIVNLNNLFCLKYEGRKMLHWPLYGKRPPLLGRYRQFFEDVRVVFYKREVLEPSWFTNQNRSFSS